MKKHASYFDVIADDYHALVNPFDLSSRLKWFASQLDRVHIEKNWVLEVGCGLGHFSRLILERKGIPVPFDYSYRLLQKTKADLSCCTRGNAVHLPFKSNSFPMVVSSECIEHTSDPILAIKEMMRVLEPGGLLFLSTPNKAWRWALTLAEALGIRKFAGIENWLSRSTIKRVFFQQKGEILTDEGLFIFPFQVRLLWPFLAWMNQYGQILRRFMINQCWVVRKHA